MKRLLIILCMIGGFSSISSATYYSFICYETIGQSVSRPWPWWIDYYTYQYCLEEPAFYKISEIQGGVYKPKADAWDNCRGNNCKYPGTVWHICQDKSSDVQWRGHNIGQGRVKYDYDTFWGSLCWQSGGSGPVTKPPTPPKVDELIFWEQNDSYNPGPDNKIYVNITGRNSYMYLRSKLHGSKNGNSGLKDARCTITTNGKSYTYVLGDVFGGGKRFTMVPPVSGHYTFNCTATNKENQSLSTSTYSFYSAPASYNISLKVQTKLGVSSLSSRDVQARYFDGQKVVHNYTTINTTMKDSILITLDAKAKTYNGSIDMGINHALEAQTLDFNIRGQCPVKYIFTHNKPRLQFRNGSIAIVDDDLYHIKFSDIGSGSIRFGYKDVVNENEINKQANAGNCRKNSTGPNGMPMCPYPPRIEFVFNMINVFPANYKLQLTDGSNPLKLLYYGQGNDPKLSGLSKLKVTAVDVNNNPIKNNTYYCAAQDIDVNIQSSKPVGDISLKLLDTNGSDNPTILASDFQNNSTATKDKIISVKKLNGNNYLPNEVQDPVYAVFDKALITHRKKENDNSYPKYQSPIIEGGDVAILRARINLIDTDNASNFNQMPSTKVIYEFYCKSCDLNKLSNITKVNKYENSPTAYNWYIDKSFSTFNKDRVNANNIDTDGINVSSTSTVQNGIQTIQYNKAPKGQYQVKVKQDYRANNPFPSYLLYNRYYDGTSSSQSRTTSWGTSSKVTIYDKLADDKRDYGLDTGNAKNTRGASRIGGF